VALYLHCAICHRKQAGGLLSGSAWGRVERPAPETALRVCPDCMSTNPDWPTRAVRSLQAESGPSAATG
jgi:hypothetical protein